MFSPTLMHQIGVYPVTNNPGWSKARSINTKNDFKSITYEMHKSILPFFLFPGVSRELSNGEGKITI